MADGRPQTIQNVFLSYVRDRKTPLTVFLVNGVRLQGIVTRFDDFTIQLTRDASSQLVYKQTIAAVVPSESTQIGIPQASA